MGSEDLHEPESKLRPGTIERHRATVSLKEELEAIDWYDQRVDASDDLISSVERPKCLCAECECRWWPVERDSR